MPPCEKAKQKAEGKHVLDLPISFPALKRTPVSGTIPGYHGCVMGNSEKSYRLNGKNIDKLVYIGEFLASHV